MIQATEFRERFYLLDDGRVRQFLLTEPGRALLIDTGFPDSHVLKAVRALTDAPVTVVLTHGDPDHVGGLGDFDEIYLHRGDWALAGGGPFHPIAEGDVFSCGGYDLEAVEIPGHTAGSIVLLERKQRLLLPGDSVQRHGSIYLFGAHRNPPQYLESLRKLAALEGAVDAILPCHADVPLPGAYLRQALEDGEALMRGELPAEPHPYLPCWVCHGRYTDFFCTTAHPGEA